MEVVHKIGRRKTSVARVYISKGSSDNIINGKKLDEYFPTAALQSKVKKPLVITDNLNSNKNKESRKDNANNLAILALCEAARLSCLTGSPEQPDRILEMFQF